MRSVYLNPVISVPCPEPEVVEGLFLVTAWIDTARPVFDDFLAGRLLVDCLRQQQHRADTWAFVVMPDYMNWLVQRRRNMSLHKLVERVLTSSNTQLCHYLGCTEFLWRPQYHQQSVSSAQAAITIARDMVRAPLRARLASSVGDYPLWDAPRWMR